MAKRMQCNEARAGIRQLIGNLPYVTNYDPDKVVRHVQDCESCQASIQKSIEGGSTSYAESVGATITAAREANPRYPSGTERTGAPTEPVNYHYRSGKEKY